jgi:methionyl-tRNA formyltransferase
MRIFFIGSVEFSWKALEKLIELGADVVGVCSKEQSAFNSDFTDLKPLCTANDIPCKYVTDINAVETVHWIKAREPHVIFCFGWSALIKADLLCMAPLGVIGYHPTKLPENRGRHPLIWALVLGLTKTGSTFFFMDEGADSGDILSQKTFEIFADDNANTVYTKMTRTALEQIEEFLPRLQNNSYIKKTQNHGQANSWRKRTIRDGLIDFRMTSESIQNLVRALTKPYVGAHLLYQKKDIKVWVTQIYEQSTVNIEPGKVLAVADGTVLVKTGNGAIKILDHGFEVLPSMGEYL